MNRTARIFVAGHRGLVGSAFIRSLEMAGYSNILVRNHGELDLTRQEDVERFFEIERPEYVFLAAARVGGILANSSRPAEFIYENLMISTNVIDAAFRSGVRKLLNLGSSCIYPRDSPQPIREEYLLTGPLEETNEAYAIAKIAAIKLCKYYNQQFGTDFISLMPTNLYGPGDNYDLSGGHVLPAIIRKFHEAKVRGDDHVVLWGDGSPYREFLFSEDLADASVYLMVNKSAQEIGDFINVGTGVDLPIRTVADLVKRIVYEGHEGITPVIIWDSKKPNGTPRKLLDVSRMKALGWISGTSLEEGIRKSYRDFVCRQKLIDPGE
jgi:GDP-L-fucose synthase